VDPEVEALYGLPLDEFTKARDVLAKERGKSGDKAGAAEVKAQRKPSVTAWALNQLARRHPADVDALLEAGQRVREAQTAALEGDPSGLREASREEAVLVQGLAERALGVLAEAGRAATPTQQERLAATLRAAAVDAEAGDRLRRGVLATELSPAGFGFGVADEDSPLPDFRASTADSPRSTHVSRKEERKGGRKDGREEARKDEERAERQRQREREQELRAAREAAARLEREADRAEDRALEARAAAEAAMARAEALAEALNKAPGASTEA